MINEETGYLYAVGSRTCAGGLHIVDIRDPSDPQFAGCFADDGYTHDAECVVYSGPDSDYTGHELCFCYNEDTLTIVDVTHKDDMKMITRFDSKILFSLTHYFYKDMATKDRDTLIKDG